MAHTKVRLRKFSGGKLLALCGSVAMKRGQIALAVVGFGCVATAATYYVSPTGGDDNGGTSWGESFLTIQHAVDAAASGDTVIVSNGTYLIDCPIVVPSTKVLTIKSFSDNRDDVIVDGQHKTHCFAFFKNGNNTLRGITVRNGVGSAYMDGSAALYTGGVYMESGTISNCRVTDCHTSVNASSGATLYGGGIYSGGGKVINCMVYNCTLTNVNTATSGLTVYGGGIYARSNVDGTIVSNCEIYVEYPNYTGRHVITCAGGGILLESSGTMTNCVVADCRAVCGTATSVGCGGGVAMFGGSANARIVDTFVHGCRSTRAGGGIAFRAAGSIVGCTISNNSVIVTKDDSGYDVGAGIQIDDSASGARTVENCLICFNTITNSVMTHGSACGGGGIGIQASSAENPVTVRNCLIRENRGFNGGAILLTGGTGIVVSNCWASGNFSPRRGGFAYATLSTGALFADCRMDGHAARWTDGNAQTGQLFARHCEGNSTNNEIIFRNCYITGNNPNRYDSSHVWMFKGVKPGHSPVLFEQCTFTGNLGSNYLLDMSGSGAGVLSAVSNICVKGCAFYGNGTNKLLSGSVAEVDGVMTYSYSDERTNMPTDTGSHNLTDVSDPKFVDAVNGDYRLQTSSRLKNAGGSVEAWMGTSAKTGPQDMGDGTFTMSAMPGTTYGIVLSRNDTLPRLIGSAPDIGCFECWTPFGLMMIVK